MKAIITIILFIFSTVFGYANTSKDSVGVNDSKYIAKSTNNTSGVTITIENESIGPKDYHIEVTKINGTPLLFKQVESVDLNNTSPITESLKLETGTYILNIYEGNTKVYSQTFIKD